jgi:hypothetical protein
MVMVFAADAERPGSDIRARMYGPSVAVAEDPRRGRRVRAFAGYLAARTPRDGTLKWVVEQGFEMGRPSILEIEADKDAGKITAVRVGGRTVLVIEGRVDRDIDSADYCLYSLLTACWCCFAANENPREALWPPEGVTLQQPVPVTVSRLCRTYRSRSTTQLLFTR